METLWQLEANIDDMNPQNMEYVFSQILDKGANDVWAMPMMMKKGRMASMLCVLCRKEILDDMIETIVKETTSIGVRFFPVSRMACDRVITTVCIDGRDLHCKICRIRRLPSGGRSDGHPAERMAAQGEGSGIPPICRIVSERILSKYDCPCIIVIKPMYSAS